MGSIFGTSNESLLAEAKQIVKDFTMISCPQIIYQCCIYLRGMFNLFYISHTYKDADMLNAVGIANLYVNITTNIILSGITGALETLASTVYGAKNYRLLGIYFDRCRYIGLTFILCVLIFDAFCARFILQALKVEERVIDFVLEYVHIYAFSFVFFVDFEINIKFFVLIEKSYYNTIISGCSLIIHAIICGIFVMIFDLGIRGASLATALSAVFNMVSSVYLIHCQGLPKETLVYFTKDGLREWWSYLRIAIPGVLISGGEWLGYEIQGIFALFLSSLSYSTILLTTNLETLLFPITLGISTAVALKTGEKLTKDDSSTLKKFITICYCFSFIMAICGVCIVDFLGTYFCYVLSPNYEIYDSCSSTRWYVGAYVFVVNLFYFYLGVLKALGYLNNPTIVSFIIFYIVEIPLTYIFAFKIGMDVKGIWTSMVTGCSIGGIIYVYWTYSFDMEEMKQKALERIDDDNKHLLGEDPNTREKDDLDDLQEKLLDN